MSQPILTVLLAYVIAWAGDQKRYVKKSLKNMALSILSFLPLVPFFWIAV